MHRVLVVDDHADNCVPLVRLLGFNGIDGECADGGRTALAALHRRATHLVLLDVMMPEMDGLACLTLIRADCRHDAVAVLMHTAADDPATAARARELGAQGYLVKGTGFGEILAAVRRHLPAW